VTATTTAGGSSTQLREMAAFRHRPRERLPSHTVGPRWSDGAALQELDAPAVSSGFQGVRALETRVSRALTP
jgi:hypothetical protein